MRVMFTTFAARSHLLNQVSLAWALRSAGHEVCVASHPDLTEHIVRTGLTAAPVGEPLELETRSRVEHDSTVDTGQDPALLEEATLWAGWPEILDIGEPRVDRLTYDYLHGVLSAYAPWVFWYPMCQIVNELVAFARHWRPDLVVWDPMTFAGPVAAVASGAAHARLLFGLDLIGRARHHYLDHLRRLPVELREDPVEECFASILESYGIPFTEELVNGHWSIDPVLPSLRVPTGGHPMSVRFVPYHGPAAVPDWLREPPARRRVCVTLGVSSREVLGRDRGAIGEVLAAVADLDVEVVATLTTEQLRALPDLPGNVRAVDFVPLDALLPSCSAVVHHGGSGSFQTALWHGVPQILIPAMMWDTVIKAKQLAAHGAGLHVSDVDNFTAAEVRAMLVRVLDDPSFAANAARLRAEMLAIPTPADVVPAIERLTQAHRSGT